MRRIELVHARSGAGGGRATLFKADRRKTFHIPAHGFPLHIHHTRNTTRRLLWLCATTAQEYADLYERCKETMTSFRLLSDEACLSLQLPRSPVLSTGLFAQIQVLPNQRLGEPGAATSLTRTWLVAVPSESSS